MTTFDEAVAGRLHAAAVAAGRHARSPGLCGHSRPSWISRPSGRTTAGGGQDDTPRVSAGVSSVECIAIGVRLLADHLQRAGEPIPPVLHELNTAFTAAMRGQERTQSDTAARASRPTHDEHSNRHWLTPQQAAEVAGVSTRTIRRWVESGALASARCGRIVRIARPELDRHLTATEKEAARKLPSTALRSRPARPSPSTAPRPSSPTSLPSCKSWTRRSARPSAT